MKIIIFVLSLRLILMLVIKIEENKKAKFLEGFIKVGHFLY